MSNKKEVTTNNKNLLGSLTGVLLFVGLGIFLKVIAVEGSAIDTLSSFLVFFPLVFLIPLLQVVLKIDDSFKPKTKDLFFVAYIVFNGAALYLTSLKDMNSYCQDGGSKSCTISTVFFIFLYFTISALIFYVNKEAENNQKKQVKKYKETEQNHKKEINEYKEQIKNLKEQINNKAKVSQNNLVKEASSISFEFLKIFKITINKK